LSACLLVSAARCAGHGIRQRWFPGPLALALPVCVGLCVCMCVCVCVCLFVCGWEHVCACGVRLTLFPSSSISLPSSPCSSVKQSSILRRPSRPSQCAAASPASHTSSSLAYDGLQRRYNDITTMVQRCYNDATTMSQWCNSSVTVVLQCWCRCLQWYYLSACPEIVQASLRKTGSSQGLVHSEAPAVRHDPVHLRP
jgi:hypothetical protein